MRTFQTTKGRAVERVIPLSSLGYCKAVGKSEREECAAYAQAFDNCEKARWRTGLFVRYAHRLLECSERVFADERLFYAPLPLPLRMWAKKGAGYTPVEMSLTLGHILVWWQDYRCAQVVSEDGERHYIFGFDIVRGKFGFPTKPYKLRYIGKEGQAYCTETDISIPELGASLYEVCCQYGTSNSYFELEDAIEYLLGERVYQRL